MRKLDPYTMYQAMSGHVCKCDFCQAVWADLVEEATREPPPAPQNERVSPPWSSWRARRQRVNDEQALDDMLARGTPADDVPRGTHQEDQGGPPSGRAFAWGAVLAVAAIVTLLVLYMVSCGGSLDDACRR